MNVENILAKVGENLSVRRAFGTAYEKDGMLIIPVALVAGGGGGGVRLAGSSTCHRARDASRCRRARGTQPASFPGRPLVPAPDTDAGLVIGQQPRRQAPVTEIACQARA